MTRPSRGETSCLDIFETNTEPVNRIHRTIMRIHRRRHHHQHRHTRSQGALMYIHHHHRHRHHQYRHISNRGYPPPPPPPPPLPLPPPPTATAVAATIEVENEFRFQHPFTANITGPTGCGKTYFVKALPQSCRNKMAPPPQRIVWLYKRWQPLYDVIRKTVLPRVEFRRGIPMDLDSDDFFDPRIINVIVLDDLMSTVTKDPWINDLFTEGSHHRNRSEPKHVLWPRSHAEEKLSLPGPVQESDRSTTHRDARKTDVPRTGPRLFIEIRRSHEGTLLVPGRGSEARNPGMEETMYQRLRGRSIGRHADRSNDLSGRH